MQFSTFALLQLSANSSGKKKLFQLQIKYALQIKRYGKITNLFMWERRVAYCRHAHQSRRCSLGSDRTSRPGGHIRLRRSCSYTLRANRCVPLQGGRWKINTDIFTLRHLERGMRGIWGSVTAANKFHGAHLLVYSQLGEQLPFYFCGQNAIT